MVGLPSTWGIFGELTEFDKRPSSNQVWNAKYRNPPPPPPPTHTGHHTLAQNPARSNSTSAVDEYWNACRNCEAGHAVHKCSPIANNAVINFAVSSNEL